MTIKKCKDCKKVLRIYSRGLCTTCYQRLRRLGKLGKYKSVRVIRWKKKKMLKGIPSLLVWYPCEDRDMDVWYIPSDSVLSSNLSDVNAFFVRCKEKAKQLCK